MRCIKIPPREASAEGKLNRMPRQAGFASHASTMLMIAAAIVGIALAVLVPVWQERRHGDDARGAIARAVSEADGLRKQVEAQVARTGRFAIHAGELAPDGKGPPPPGGVELGRPIVAVGVPAAGDGRIEARVLQKGIVEVEFYRVSPLPQFASLRYTPGVAEGRVAWRCEASGLGERFRPSGCESR